MTTLPAKPGVGGGNNQRPGERPNPGDFLGITKPAPLPGVTRPGPGGGDRPIAGGGGDRPNPGITRPTPLPERPGGDNRPTRPGGDVRPTPLPGRPGDLVNRPGDNNRPWRPGDNNRPGGPGGTNRPNWGNGNGNTVIHNRPSWVNQNNINNVTINNQWNNAFVRPARPNWWVRPNNRPDRWNTWGVGVRHGWGGWGNRNLWFTNSWWNGHYHALPGWHYGFGFNRYPSYYWWRRPAWVPLAAWFTWTAAPPVVWQQPVYYDYGPDGNVQYQNNIVYVGGQPVASAASYAMTAAELATVPPPENEAQAEAEEWMPLGTFAVSSSEQDVDPDRVVQLAVSKTGIVSGVLFSNSTDTAQSIQGKVDMNTQRVAFRIGENENVVVETGLGNLTQNEAAALVHYGADRQETWLLVRIDNPDDPEATTDSE